MRTRWILPVLALITGPLLMANPVGSTIRSGGDSQPPTVTPATGGKGAPTLATAGLAAANGTYQSEEFLVEGSATSYAPVGELGSNGKWKAEEADTAPYKTRIVVFRPSDAADFNGTVFVEWLNVTAGSDSGPDWIAAHTEIIRMGAAWVGVSAQEQGVQGSAEEPGGVKAADPERYGTLTHPGDAYSYDIFTQMGLTAQNDTDPAVLGDLDVQRVIAVGESQSAFRLTTYVNAVHPLVGAFDAFLIHSRGGSAASFSESEGAGQADSTMPNPARIRRDLDVPVLTFQTETDLTRLGFIPSRQKDSKSFRLWEVAGSAHADAYTLAGFGDDDSGATEATLLDPAKASGGALSCDADINAGPTFAVLNAAFLQLDEWVRDGEAPPRAPRIKTDGEEIVRDEHGNAVGGIRTPIVDVAIAANDGDPNAGGSFCALFGNTKPFDAATLASLYPTHDDYVGKFNESADATVKAGFWLEADAEQYKTAAASLPIPS